MRKSDRLFQLTNILRAHQPITASALAKRLSVSERTIYRYIDDLSLSGIPIYGEPGVGYRLSDGFEMRPLQLTSLELEALIVGVNLVTSWTGKRLGQASLTLLSKIEASFPEDQHRNNEPIPTRGGKLNEIDRKHWDLLHQSIEKKFALKLNYLSLSGSPSQRMVFPLGLFYWGNKWTVGSWCSLKKEYRDFRIDRILLIEKITTNIELDAAINLSDYMTVAENRMAQCATDRTLSVV